MAVYIWERDAFIKFLEVESFGNEKDRKQIIHHQRLFGECSFWAFLQRWHELYAQNPEMILRSPPRSIRTEFITKRYSVSNSVIYGHGGWNRWLVYSDGEMILIEGLSSHEPIRIAKAQGFRTDNFADRQLAFPF